MELILQHPEFATATFYVRDASGNVMAVYKTSGTTNLSLEEQHIYGSSRLGIFKKDKTRKATTRALGERQYELTDHLGNVRAVLSDYKKAESIVLSATDYYPFGMVARTYTSPEEYRYGFNGKEADNEAKGKGNSYDYKERIYDPRLGRFLSVDKLTSSFPFYSPYQFAGNMPIIAIDLDGLEPKYMITEQGRLTKPMMTLMNASFGYNMKRMEKTKWKEVSFDFGAITLYKTVHYDHYYNHDEFTNPSEWVSRWADLIVHEQKHRNEIGNFIGRAIGWYIGYGFDYLFARFNYNKINAEERAYGMEPSMQGLMAYNGGIALKILHTDKYGDEDKSAALRYVGLSYKLETEQNKLSSLKTQLENYSGGDRGRKKLEKKITKQEGSVNNFQTEVNSAKTAQVDKVISDVK